MKVKNLCIADTYVVTHPYNTYDFVHNRIHYQPRKSNVLYLYDALNNIKLCRCYKDAIDGELYSYGFSLEADIGQGFIMPKTLDFSAVSDMLASCGYIKPTISKRKLKRLLREKVENKKNEE